MRVRFYRGQRGERSSLVERFLSKYKIKHELVDSRELAPAGRLSPLGGVPALEVDGRLFVNPNDDALKKILHVG